MVKKPYFAWFLCGVLCITALRVGFLFLSPLGLHGDEAQYWSWSKDLDWGYFTKPPLIAWVIWTTTSIFGDAEWSVRLSSAPLHFLTSLVIYFTAKKVFDSQTGILAALIYFLMPAVWLSSQIVSTDVSLLLCYAVALNGWVHLREGGGSARLIQLGAAIGFGMLAKYAMLFFLPALGFAIIWDKKTRDALLKFKALLPPLLAALIIAPNIMWNLRHDFATFSHTAANTNMHTGGVLFNPQELGEFFISQFAVFGPISFGLLIFGACAFLFRRNTNGLFTPLAVFALCPLVIISFQALLSRANANWAVTTYIAGSILVAHIAVVLIRRSKPWVIGGLAAQSLLSLFLMVVILSPMLTNQLGRANDVKRLREWPQTVQSLQDVIAKGHDGQSFQMIATDKRIIYYDLLYYGLGETLPLYMWKYRQAPENHAELKYPLPSTRQGDEPVLIVHYEEKYEEQLKADFSKLVPLPPLKIDLGGGTKRELQLWAGYGYTPTNRS